MVAAVIGVALGGCGTDVERSEASRVADAFVAAEAGAPQAACDRLAPRAVEDVEDDGEQCATVLADLGLPTAGARADTTVAGHSAQVRYAGDTVFLALFADGWRVTAAGCDRTSTDPAVPYECSIDGG